MASITPTIRPDHVPDARVVDFDIFAPPGAEEDYFAAWKSLRGGLGLVWTPRNHGHWIATRGAIIRELWGDSERLSSEALAVTPGLGEMMDFIPLQLDPPQHKPFRNAVMRGFANHHVTAMMPMVRDVSRDLIAGLAPQGGCEFMTAFAEIVPLHIFLSLIGVPVEDRARLRPLGQQLTRPAGLSLIHI